MMETTMIEEVATGRERKELTVYDFAMSYSAGTTFELKPGKNHRPSEVSPSQVQSVVEPANEENRDSSQQTSNPSSLLANTNQIDQNNSQNPDQSTTQLIAPTANDLKSPEDPPVSCRKFLSANVFVLRKQGHRVLVVRDESQTMYMQDLKRTKEVMPAFTQQMMSLIDRSAQMSQAGMNQLVPYTQPGARDFCDSILNEIHKTRYTVRGYAYLYDIVEEVFAEPGYKRLQILQCLNEIKNVSKTDLTTFCIEAKI